jgi:ABC-2 type transport system permease protein
MFGRLKQMLIKEFIQVFRDKRTRFMLIGPPIIQMLVFGYAATYEIHHVPTVVLDLDHSQESRELVSRFTSSPYFDVQRQLTDARPIRDLIDKGDATVGLEIDAGFAQKLRKGQTAPLQVIVDATNSNTALIASGYITQIALGFAKDYQQDRIYRIAPQFVAAIPSIELEQRPWYNAELSSRWFFVPGVIGSLTLILVITLTAFAVVREREIGTLEQIMVTPIRPAEFILGKTLPFFLIGVADVLLIALVGSLWFQVPFRGNVAVLALGAVLFILCMLGVGLLISTVSSTQQQAMVTAFFFIMPAITFSGFGFPISTMPLGMQYFSYCIPLRYFLVILRGVYLKGVGMDILWPQMAAMAAMAAMAFGLITLSILRFHKALD